MSLTNEILQVWMHANSIEEIVFQLRGFPVVLLESPKPNTLGLELS